MHGSVDKWQNYLLWLGSRGQKWPKLVPVTPSEPLIPAKNKQIAIFISTEEFDAAADQLWNKMLAATKLSKDDYLLVSNLNDEISWSNISCALVFDRPLALSVFKLPPDSPQCSPGREDVVECGGQKILCLGIQHPAQLMGAPHLKAQAWSSMQKGLKHFAQDTNREIH